MTSVLSIQSSARSEGSFSRQLSAELIETLKSKGDVELIERDLNDPISHIDEQWLAANWTSADERSDQQSNLLSASDELISELKSADILVFGVSMYNFSIPASLKAWIDMVARAGQTFNYTANGPVGLLEGKKAYVVVTSGGVPVDSAMDFATPYMRQVLGFIGITDVEVIGAAGMVTEPEAGLAAARLNIERAAA